MMAEIENVGHKGGDRPTTGAIAGSFIAGDVGAVIGSRRSTDAIKSELITHDERRTVLHYFDDNNEKRKFYFDVDSYDKFFELLPEKSYEIVNKITADKILTKMMSENITQSIPDQIREFAKLRDEGIISEEEFQQKKRELLNLK